MKIVKIPGSLDSETLEYWRNRFAESVPPGEEELEKAGIKIEEVPDVPSDHLTIIKIGDETYKPSMSDLESWRQIFEEAGKDKNFKIFTHESITIEKVPLDLKADSMLITGSEYFILKPSEQAKPEPNKLRDAVSVIEEEFGIKPILVRTDLESMLLEIKTYTLKNNGEIYPLDNAHRLTIGFIHEGGTCWEIKIKDMKESLKKMTESGDPKLLERADLLRKSFQSADGKKALYTALSTIKEEK